MEDSVVILEVYFQKPGKKEVDEIGGREVNRSLLLFT